MANYQLLKADIDTKVYENAQQKITGENLNSVLNQMVTTLGAEYQFAGVATTDTNPGTPDAKVFYIANGKGKYTNFGGIEVTEDDVVVLCYDTSWHKVSTGIASQAKLSELESEFATKQDIILDLDTIRAGAALGASSLQKETDPSVPSWAKAATKPSYTPAEIGAASEDSLQSHENDNTRHITEIERTKWNGKQDALTLTVKDNGNIVLANIQGQSKEFMPATPSGDPMHYAYVTVGAEYNDTGADIVKTAPWADMIDDDYTGDYGKTVVHKAGYWYLNGLGDITNVQMQAAYSKSILCGLFTESMRRSSEVTNVNFINMLSNHIMEGYGTFSQSSFQTILLNSSIYGVRRIAGAASTFSDSIYLLHIIGTFSDYKNNALINVFYNCNSLITLKFKELKHNVSFSDSPNLSVKSVLFMIKMEKATSPITITLHANVYNRCMANADILAALQAHPNISLASAES